MSVLNAISAVGLIAALCTVAVAQPATGVVKGRVYLSGSESTPVAQAEVTLSPDNLTQRTDSAGYFRFRDVAVGTHAIRVRRIGFDAATLTVLVTSEQESVIGIALRVGAQLLSEVTVNGTKVMVPARLAEPYQRMAFGNGWFFSRALIDSVRPYDIKSLLPRIPGAHVNDRGVQFARCTTGAAFGSEAHVQIYVDGTRLTNYTTRIGGFSVNDALRTVPMASIELVEVYQGITRIPAAYLDDACAVILIWTR